jgi:hypothetical protein
MNVFVLCYTSVQPTILQLVPLIIFSEGRNVTGQGDESQYNYYHIFRAKFSKPNLIVLFLHVCPKKDAFLCFVGENLLSDACFPVAFYMSHTFGTQYIPISSSWIDYFVT